MRRPIGLPLPEEDLEDLSARIGTDWFQLDGARLLLTGCTGFFGAWLVEGLLAAVDQGRLHVQATLLTRDPAGFRQRMPHIASHPAIQLHEGDVRTFAVPPGSFTHLVHGATTPSATLNAEQPWAMLDTILEGTRHTLEMAGAAGVRDAVYLSSGAVYGLQPAEVPGLQETYPGAPDPLNPLSSYGLGKRLAEHLCCLAAQGNGMRIRIARCFSFLGPRQALDSHQAAPSFLANALRNQAIQVQGDGTAVRSWMYGKDLAWWLWSILLRGQPGCAYNVGSDQSMDIASFAELVAKVCGSEVRIKGVPIPGRLPQRYVPDTRHARSELGLCSTLPLEDAIRRTIDWHRAVIRAGKDLP